MIFSGYLIDQFLVALWLHSVSQDEMGDVSTDSRPETALERCVIVSRGTGSVPFSRGNGHKYFVFTITRSEE